VDIDGYDRVSPNKPVGRALNTGQVGDRFSLREGCGSITILDITD
jgi:transcription elongation GreA/GreB family factor